MSKTRCAIYVRKSTEHGLDMEFNSLDNQEQACRAYIMSQTFQGWEFFKTYLDGGISGGTMARPGLQELLTDIRAGKIQCVLVYKIDRLSRSIYDFKRMMKKDFEPNNCNLVSITQSFDTSNAMGKLTLNMLLSFAEFEREVASERVRDKMRATKAKGMWVGGIPPIEYDVVHGKLVVNKDEVPVIQTIFQTYLESASLVETCEKLRDAGIHGKKWTTRHGVIRGGEPIAKSSLSRILSNPIFTGKMPNKSSNEVFDGQHDAILDIAIFNAAVAKLKQSNNHDGAPYRRSVALLHNKIMTAAGDVFKNHIGNKDNKKYRYYRAGKISLPMGDIDNIVVDTLQKLLDSDLTILPPDKELEFKCIKFSNAIIDQMIDKIIYTESKISIFINISDLKYLIPFQADNYINTNNAPMPDIYTTTDQKYIVVSRDIYLSRKTSTNQKSATGEIAVLTKSENDQTLIRALAYGWKYQKLYESDQSVRTQISRDAKCDHRTIYKYLNLAYLSPRIVNDIMSHMAPQNINLQTLFSIASKYDDFTEQEFAFYGV